MLNLAYYEQVWRLLFNYDKALSEKELYNLIGGREVCKLEELRVALEANSRFNLSPSNYWSCASLEELIENKQIRDTTFVITDIETTGSIKGKDRIIDLAAVKVKNGEIIDTFNCLVNPDMEIPRMIVKLTGISQNMVANEPNIQRILPSYLEFLADNVFVAHNSSFDFPFINFEAKRLGLVRELENIELCTLRIAKKLLPQLSARGVTGLSKYFKYDITDRHRAMSDVLATKFFLDKFIVQLKEREIVTLHEMIEFQKEKMSRKKLIQKMKKNRKKMFRNKI